MHHLSQHLQHCIDNCSKCHQLCLSMIAHCQSLGGAHASQDHLRLLHDCSEICQTSANFMLRQSPLHTLTCGACAQICQLCANQCQALGGDDSCLQECIRACNDCAQSCAEMSQAASGR